MVHKVALLLAVNALFLLPTAASADSCGHLTALTIPDTTITSAMVVNEGQFSPTQNGRPMSFTVPEFCRVQAVASPTSDSDIHIEIWLPSPDKWNGKLLGTGNGGYSSALSYWQMADAVNEGYVTAGSDTGHQGEDLAFGLGHLEKINDWAYRAVHVMTETAQLVIRSYYRRFPAHSYFVGCSTGGQQALSEAQRYPGDYDGIVAGAPGNDRVRLNVGFLWNWRVLNEAGTPLPASKLPMIHRAVLAACDALDGLKDGVISDPRRCKFDPGQLLCHGSDQPDCLTQSQVTAVREIYAGARDPRTGEQLLPGWPPGSEVSQNSFVHGWDGYFVGRSEPTRVGFWRDWVFNDPDWDPKTFDFDRDIQYADRKMAFVTANDPNLVPFQRSNGKMIMYQGWADPIVPAEDTIRYYENVHRVVPKTMDFLRLFMVPGMSHCIGGSGPTVFDALGALDRWVVDGVPPEQIIASHSTNGEIDETRPLCPWPEVAVWSGKGSTNDAAEFACRPER